MDKQLIFRLRQCADASSDWIGDSLRDIANQLERIDAERGKGAVAWVDTLDAVRPRCVTSLDYRSLIEAELGVEYVPLFRSPTIPEGMCLVQKDAERYRAIRDGDHDDEAGFCAVDGQAVYGESLDDYCDKYIAAAQGEK